MTGQSDAQPKLPTFRRLAIGLWWTTLFCLPLLADINHDVVLVIFFSHAPAALLTIFLLGILLWILIATSIALFRRRWKQAAMLSSAPVIGAGLVFAGLFAGDQWLIHITGSGLETAVADAQAGRPAKNPISATAAGAYIETSVFFDMAQGIAYDTTGQMGEMMALEIGERPEAWMKIMPPQFSCSGGARHLGGRYWRTNLDRGNCLTEIIPRG